MSLLGMIRPLGCALLCAHDTVEEGAFVRKKGDAVKSIAFFLLAPCCHVRYYDRVRRLQLLINPLFV